MEPEMAAFLKRVGKTLSIAFCWLAITAIAAIKGDNAFIGTRIRIGNVLFYVWLIVSIIILIRLYKMIWSAKDQENKG
jgi:hypothetical protein